MDLIADRGRRVAVEELNTSRLLAHARKQAQQRKLDDVLIVDVDAHHYENESLRRVSSVHGERRSAPARARRPRQGPRQRRFRTWQSASRTWADASRAIRMRSSEKTAQGKLRDVELGHRWMDAMSVDYSCLFPTLMLAVGLHPDPEMEVELCWAYNRWLTEKALPEAGGRLYSMLTLPLSGPRRGLAADRDLRRAQIRDRVHDHLRAQPAGASQCAI